MGRIAVALSKLNLNSNVTNTPYKDMKAKEIVDLCYHLAEVYDPEALFPETGVKKKLKVFKNFARVHSLVHLVPPVKEMKPKKCFRLVTSLLDTLEKKYGDILYTRKSWPAACKELPKIEVTVSGGGYNLDNLNLDPNAVPPEAGTREDAFPAIRKAAELPKSERGEGVQPIVKLPSKNRDSPIKPWKTVVASSSKPIQSDNITNSVTIEKDIKSTTKLSKVEETEVKNASSNNARPKLNCAKQKGEVAEHQQPSDSSSMTVKRPFQQTLTSQGSKETLKKLKTEHSACEQFIKALEELAKVRPVVEVVGWNKVIFTNQRIWKAIQNVVFSRVLLGRELRKYKAKKIVSEKEVGTSCRVIVEKKIPEEDITALKIKLIKLMQQISNAVPEHLLEDMKRAVKSSCQNVTLRIRESDDFL